MSTKFRIIPVEFIFNNYFYHVLYNHSNDYISNYNTRDNVEELKEEFIRSREEYPKGVYIDNQSNIDSVYAFNRPRGMYQFTLHRKYTRRF